MCGPEQPVETSSLARKSAHLCHGPTGHCSPHGPQQLRPHRPVLVCGGARVQQVLQVHLRQPRSVSQQHSQTALYRTCPGLPITESNVVDPNALTTACLCGAGKPSKSTSVTHLPVAGCQGLQALHGAARRLHALQRRRALRVGGGGAHQDQAVRHGGGRPGGADAGGQGVRCRVGQLDAVCKA